MLVGLLSDTHDDLARTEQALALLGRREPELLLHAGDLTTGHTVPLLTGFKVLLVQGNIDRPRDILAAIQEEGADVSYAVRHQVELDGTRVGVIHGDDAGRLEGMINSGAFELVVHGHTHAFRDEQVGSTRVVNPGAVHRTSQPSVCLYDTEADRLERLLL